MSNAFKKSFSKLTSAVGIQQPLRSNREVNEPILSKQTLQILQALPDASSLHSVDGDALWLSDGFQKFHNKDVSVLLCKGYLEGINPQDKLNVLKAFSDCSANRAVQSIIFRMQVVTESKAVETRSFEMKISLFDAGQEDMFLALVRDVTEQQETLYQARQETKDAEASNSTKSLFLSHVSHELRTPLNAIIGFSQMLMGEASLVFSEEKKVEYASLVNQSATHLLDVINDILDLSKIEAGKFQVISELFDPAKELKTTMQLMEPIAKKGGISLDIKVGEDIPEISADPRTYRQVVINLVANAIKFSNPGDNIRIRLLRNRRKIQLEIIDAGIGMSAETLEQLGNAFFQAEQTTTKHFEGTGLGLSIVFGLIKLQEGNISIDSTPDQGTRIIVDFPIISGKALPVPADPDDSIVFLNQKQQKPEIDLANKLPNIRKVG